jgi:hypothetical protein
VGNLDEADHCQVAGMHMEVDPRMPHLVSADPFYDELGRAPQEFLDYARGMEIA